DRGCAPARVGSVCLSRGRRRYDQDQGLQFYRDGVAGARAVPGIDAAAVASAPPLQGNLLLTVFPEGQAQNSAYRGSLVNFNDIAPGYFETMRIPLRARRDFTDFDRPQSAEV